MPDNCYKDTDYDIGHVVTVDFLTSGDLCWADLEGGGLVLPTRNQGKELPPLKGVQAQQEPQYYHGSQEMELRQLCVKGSILSLGFTG